MPVPLADLQLAIHVVSQRSGLDLAGPGAQSHRSAQFLHAPQFAQFVNHAMRRCRIELARVRVRKSANVAGKLHARRLHPQANSEVGNFLLARVSNRDQHSLDSALPKPTRHQDSVVVLQLLFVLRVGSLEPLRFNPVHLQFQIVRQRAMYQRFLQ